MVGKMAEPGAHQVMSCGGSDKDGDEDDADEVFGKTKGNIVTRGTQHDPDARFATALRDGQVGGAAYDAEWPERARRTMW